MKLTDKQISYFLDRINLIRVNLGFSEFRVNLNPEITNYDEEAKWAEVGVDIYENEFTIQFSDKFISADTKRQDNIIVHEFIHGLLNYNKLRARACNSSDAYEFFEEDFVNRITKIIEG